MIHFILIASYCFLLLFIFLDLIPDSYYVVVRTLYFLPSGTLFVGGGKIRFSFIF